MNAITVRDSKGVLVAMGPDNGMYDPGVPAGCVRTIEGDYEAVVAEWIAKHPAAADKRIALLGNAAVPQWFKDFIS